MDAIRIVDVTDAATFGLLPPCADPSFDHRSCDYWEDADRGSKAHRASWLRTGEPAAGEASIARRPPTNPFLADLEARDDNPFALKRSAPVNPFALDADDAPAENPFAPKRAARPSVGPGAAPKLALLGRGLAVFGSYAKVLLVANAQGEERAAAYAQFGPLSAYPRALRLRELYPRLPQSPLPAVITCVAVTAGDRGRGSRADAGRVDLRRPGRARLRGRRGLSGDRPGSGRHLRRDPCVLGAGGLLRRRRRRSLPGGPPRALTPATRRHA